MKLELELPDWAMGELDRIVILSNMELVAVRQPGESKWKVKKTRCNQCGECCLMAGETLPFGCDEELKCNALGEEDGKYICTAGVNRPYRCLVDPNKRNVPDCSIDYED